MGILDIFKSRATKLQEAKSAAVQEQGFYRAISLWNTYIGLLKKQERESVGPEIQEDLATKLYASRAQLSAYESASDLIELVPATALSSIVVKRIASGLDEVIVQYCDENPLSKRFREQKETDAIKKARIKGGVTSTLELLGTDERGFIDDISYAKKLFPYADSNAKEALRTVATKHASVAAQMIAEIAQTLIVGIDFSGACDDDYSFLYNPRSIASYGWYLSQLKNDVETKYIKGLEPEITVKSSCLNLMNTAVGAYLRKTKPQAEEAIKLWVDGFFQDSCPGRITRAEYITFVCNTYQLEMPATIPLADSTSHQ